LKLRLKDFPKTEYEYFKTPNVGLPVGFPTTIFTNSLVLLEYIVQGVYWKILLFKLNLFVKLFVPVKVLFDDNKAVLLDWFANTNAVVAIWVLFVPTGAVIDKGVPVNDGLIRFAFKSKPVIVPLTFKFPLTVNLDGSIFAISVPFAEEEE